MMKLKIIMEPSADGRGYSEGNTKKEALKNIKEAILLYLEPVEDDLNYSKAS